MREFMEQETLERKLRPDYITYAGRFILGLITGYMVETFSNSDNERLSFAASAIVSYGTGGIISLLSKKDTRKNGRSVLKDGLAIGTGVLIGDSLSKFLRNFS